MNADVLDEDEGKTPEEAGAAIPVDGSDGAAIGASGGSPAAEGYDEPDGSGPKKSGGDIVLMDMMGEIEIQEPVQGIEPLPASAPESPEDRAPDTEKELPKDGIRWMGIATGQDVKVPEDLQKEIAPEGSEAPAGAEPSQDRIAFLEVKMDQLLSEFTSKLKYDSHKESIITSLHDELQQYRNDLVRRQLTPVIMDMIKVVDQVRKLTGHFRSKAGEAITREKILGALEAVPDDLEDVLSYQGVSPFRYDDAVFNPARQQVLRKLDTPDPAMDKTVAESIAPGYEWEGKVIRRELVNVYIHRAAAHEEAS